jgi:CRP/FNR family transcriptional regulator
MTETANIVEQLRQVPFFSELGDDALGEIGKAARAKKYDKGQMIFFENDPCDGFYFIRDGSVKIYKMSPGGREQVLHTLKAGDTFAEAPAFDDGLCPANAQAVEDSALLLIKRDDFEKITRAYPEVAIGLLRHFARSAGGWRATWLGPPTGGESKRPMARRSISRKASRRSPRE